jgi:hypothetical protein
LLLCSSDVANLLLQKHLLLLKKLHQLLKKLLHQLLKKLHLLLTLLLKLHLLLTLLLKLHLLLTLLQLQLNKFNLLARFTLRCETSFFSLYFF